MDDERKFRFDTVDAERTVSVAFCAANNDPLLAMAVGYKTAEPLYVVAREHLDDAGRLCGPHVMVWPMETVARVAAQIDHLRSQLNPDEQFRFQGYMAQAYVEIAE